MPDVRVRDKKTGDIRVLPKYVAESQRSKFLILGDAGVVKDKVATPNVTAPLGANQPKSEAADVKSDNGDAKESIRKALKGEDLKEAYKEKFGSYPHGRMKEESIRKALS